MRGGRVSFGDCRKFLDLLFKGESFTGRVRVPGSAFLASFLGSRDENLINEGEAKVCTSCQGDPKALSSFYFKKTENRYEAICLECKKRKVLERKRRGVRSIRNLSKTGKKFIKYDFSDISERFDFDFSVNELQLSELVTILLG